MVRGKMRPYKRMFKKEPICNEAGLKLQLQEKLYNVKQDALMIYNKFYKELTINITKGVLSNRKDLDFMFDKLNSNTYILGSISSDKLNCIDCKKAHRLSPVDIYCYISDDASAYIPPIQNKKINNIEKARIEIVLDLSSILAIWEAMSRLYEALEYNKSDYEDFFNRLTPNVVMSSITHELSHWISDILNNKHIANIVALADEYGKEYLELKYKNINLAYYEVDAYIHGIDNLKKDIGIKEYNKLSFTDICKRYPALRIIIKDIHKYDLLISLWKKAMLKRMSRENLITDEMKRTKFRLNIDKLFETFKGV